jgi:6-phosphogluconolactonase
MGNPPPGQARFEMHAFPDAAALARAAAESWLDQLARRGAAAAPPVCVALAGGRIAKEFCCAVARAARDRRALFDGVEFFWGDERCVPPDNPESNFLLAHHALLGPLGISESRIHRIRGEADPQFAAAEAEAELCRVAPLTGDGVPVLDLAFLGMGEDGHVASLFPPATRDPDKAVYRAVTGPKPPPQRITLSFAALAAAREVWVLASGAGKRAALQRSIAPGGTTPLAAVLQSRPMTKIFTDIAL